MAQLFRGHIDAVVHDHRITINQNHFHLDSGFYIPRFLETSDDNQFKYVETMYAEGLQKAKTYLRKLASEFLRISSPPNSLEAMFLGKTEVLTLPVPVMEYLGLKENDWISLLGQLNTLQLWNPQQLKEHVESLETFTEADFLSLGI